MKDIVAVRDLSVEYSTGRGTLMAVKSVSLGLRPGCVLGIVGESGSGKSTLLAAVAGLLPPSASIAAGSVACEGRRIDDLPERQFSALRGTTIAAMVQDAGGGLHPLMTVGAQVSETVGCHPRRQDEPLTLAERTAALLVRVGLDPAEVAGRHPHRLSGGQRQRVGLALALAGAPKVLLADEPTSALDTVGRLEFADLLRSLCRNSLTAAMLVTHDIGLVGTASDSIAVMCNGEIVETGETAPILRNPQHPYTRSLLAASSLGRAA